MLAKTKYRPKIAIICGSGLGHLADMLSEADSFPYEEIPNFPLSTVQGHAGKMIFGLLNGVEVMCMQGRFHYYEGYALAKCSMPVRVMKLVGCSHLICTNAAGGLNSSFNVGDIMIMKDHINIMGFAGNSPLQGPNDLRFGPRFPPMSKAYDPELIHIAQKLAREMELDHETHTGVYTCLGGPNYETVAELRMWKLLGVDAVGMSTVSCIKFSSYHFAYLFVWQVHEVITARHCDMKVFAFSLITNKCQTEYESHEEGELLSFYQSFQIKLNRLSSYIPANHDEVMQCGTKRQSAMTKFVTRMIEKIHNSILN